MASKGQMTGMLGVYLVAAELTRLGFIVSPTSRSAAGADLLVTDQGCKKTWSVQVKTNRKAAKFWLMSQHDTNTKSDTHMYVFVNIGGDTERANFLVVCSNDVASKVVTQVKNNSIWYYFSRPDQLPNNEGWELFGDPIPK
ncbi:MAG: hypothetical protein HQL01_03890 [Nitrospirae bacterium]|nr:hypothetical protein [Nitrospirota bacterium]